MRQFYNLTAERTAEDWYENTVLMPSIQDFVSLLPEKPSILDLGCGPGYESMRQSLHRVTRRRHREPQR